MPQYEVTFSVDISNEPGKATIGSSMTSSLKTTIEARNLTARQERWSRRSTARTVGFSASSRSNQRCPPAIAAAIVEAQQSQDCLPALMRSINLTKPEH